MSLITRTKSPISARRALTTAFALAALSLAPQSGEARDENGQFAVDGVGNRSCAQFLEALEAPEPRTLAIAFAGWADGFISATNALSPNTFDLTPWQSVEVIIAQMKTYCTANPDEIFVNGFGKLVASLNPARLTEQSEIVQVTWQGKAVFVYRSVLEWVRARLLEEGFSPSPDAGIYGGSFVTAIVEYQKANNLPVTGLPDMPTMIALTRP